MDGVQLPQGYSHFEEKVYFLPVSSQKFLVLILSTSEGWKANVDLKISLLQCILKIYANVDLKISLYIRVYIKIIPWKCRILSLKNYQVINP